MASLRSVFHAIAFITILFLTIYLSLVPTLLFIKYYEFPDGPLCLYLLKGAFYILCLILNLILGFMLVPPLLFRIFRLKPKAGIHEMKLEDKEFFKWFVGGALFQISFKIANALSFLAKTFVVKAFGGKVGKNSWIVGDVTEPYLFEMGDNSIIAGQAIVNNHVSEHGVLILDYVKIGNNCLVGEKSIVMPGVVLEDNVLVGALSFVPKNRHLTRGIWAGNPVKFIKDIPNKGIREEKNYRKNESQQ